jgi:hypothetical protein
MSTHDAPLSYEFTREQNDLIGGLGGKMGFVGTFAIVLGVLNLIVALLVVAAIYRDNVPAEWKARSTEYMERVRDQLPADVRAGAERYSLDRLPPNTQLWGVAINGLAIGIFYLLMGAWTRSAGDSFRKIAETRGADVPHLMNGLGALNAMYSLLYTLLMIVLIVGILGLGLAVYNAFFA